MKEIIKKLKFKEAGVILNAPPAITQEFTTLGFSTGFDKKEQSSNTLVFVNNNAEYLDFLQTGLKKVVPDSVLWFAYPKGTSKIKTDINRDILRVTGEEYSITAVTIVSVDDTWSALRFRPVDKVGK